MCAFGWLYSHLGEYKRPTMAVSLPQSLEGLQGEERWGWNENGAEAFVQVSSQDLDKVGGGWRIG